MFHNCIFFFTVLLFLFYVPSECVFKPGRECELFLEKDLDHEKEPLILEVHGKSPRFIWPEVKDSNGVIYVHHNSKLLLACPGEDNIETVSGKQTATVTCSHGKLKIEGKHVTKSTTSCRKKYAESTVHVTKTSCGKRPKTGVLVKLGFELNDGSFYPLVDVCHNIRDSVTYYASHELRGSSLPARIEDKRRRPFSRGPKPLYPNVDPSHVYQKVAVKKAFEQVLGKKITHKYFKNASSYLARGHLAPDADFIYHTGQLLSFYYVNAAPQWQQFNGGNWVGVENIVRELATQANTTVTTHTGTYGILQLEDEEGKRRTMYLDPSKKLIPVPQIYWKLVQNPRNNKCTVAVGHNNPFLTSAPRPICRPVHPKGWPELVTLKKGYTYYCEYESFKKKVDYVPDTNCKGGLFQFV